MGLGQFFEFEDSIHNPRFLNAQIVGYGTQDSKNCELWNKIQTRAKSLDFAGYGTDPWYVKQYLDRKNVWYYHTTIRKSNLESKVSICHMHVFGSQCVSIFFHWENTGQIGNLWNVDVWRQILTAKMCDATTPLYKNQTLTHRYQFFIFMFLVHHV
jgi:hypothetical protein